MAISVIQFQDPTGEVLVARMPPEGTAEFVLGSQLIVQDGQIAVFYRDGRPTDAFKAGRYSIDTRNLPVLSKLLKLATYGLKSPFRAYVYFIYLKTFINLGWGTPTPILFRDTEFKAVHIRAHGSFSLRVAHASTFLKTIIGSQGLETTFAIQEYVRRIIISRFANILPSILETVLDLPARYREIEVSLKKAVHDDLDQYGLRLVDLLVEAVTVPPEVQQMIDRAAGTRALDESELKRYKAAAMSDALRDAAKQPGGDASGLTAGIGLGAGLGMAHELVKDSDRQAQQGGPPPIPGAIEWYAAIEGKQAGPFTRQALAEQVKAGKVTKQTLVWHKGMANWAAADQVQELNSLFGAEPPPIPSTGI